MEISTAFNLTGIMINLLGAYFGVSAFKNIKPKEFIEQISTYPGYNSKQFEALVTQKYMAIAGFGCIFAGSLIQLMGVSSSIKGEINIQMNMLMIGLAIIYHLLIKGLTVLIRHYADQDINKVMIPKLYKQYQHYKNVTAKESQKDRSVEMMKDDLMKKRKIIESLAERLKVKELVMGSALEEVVLEKVEDYLSTLDEEELKVDL